ncbi:MAG: hypothetical protein U0166_10710 [Acidobacteriota bacterium]
MGNYLESSTFSKKTLRWLVPLVVFAILIGIRMTVFKPFDSAEWKRPGPGDQRQGMYLDLVLWGRLKGLTREQVIDKLGEPSRNPGLKGYALVYAMGTKPFSINKAWLAIKFNAGDRVDSVDFRSQ